MHAGPDLYTARQVVNSHPVMLAFLQNLYVQALLAKNQIIQVCIACQIANMDGNALLAKYLLKKMFACPGETKQSERNQDYKIGGQYVY